MPEYIRITYVRSRIGRNYRQGRVLKALGLRRLQQSRVVVDNPSIRGMIRKIPHLLTIEAADKPVTAVKTKAVIPKVTETPVKAKPKTVKKPKDTETPVKAKPKTVKKPKDTKPTVKTEPKTKKKPKDTEPLVKAEPKTKKKPKAAKPPVEAKPQTKKKLKAEKPDKSEVSKDLIKDDAVAPVIEAKTTEEPTDVKDVDTETGSNA
ncbi:50S ribosomal protein L30 [bacterium]|nr:50S ribosomal protein L30 [bacterium]